jgi:hypothetical protein
VPCPEGGSTEPLLTNIPVLDWSRVHVYTPAGIHVPSTRSDLVAIVRKVEKSGSKAKAVGSVYSLSNAPDSDDFVIDTKRLNCHLSQPFPPPPTPLADTRWLAAEGWPERMDTFRSKDHNNAWLADFAGDDLPRDGRHLVHVEAGIRIRQLLADLDSADLAVPTMGAAGGQTLAGALSTSTHGADLDLGTLGDYVRAVHLVAVDGQEWWIERNGGAGRFVEYSAWPGWCADMRIVRDSDFLESVIVGVGRFGIIYSMVLEVRKQYRLEELRHKTTWSKVRRHLVTAVTSGYTSAAGGLFEEPAPCQQIADALGELKQGTYEVFDPDLKEYIELPSTPEMIEAKQKELDACLAKYGKEKGPGPRATQIVLDSASRSLVWISQRRAIVNDEPDEFGGAFSPFGYLCTQDFETRTLVQSAASAAATTLHNLGVGALAGGSPGTAKEFFELSVGLAAAAASMKTLGEFVAKVLDLLKEFNDLGIGVIDDLLKEISAIVLGGEHDPYLRRGRSGRIMDLHNYKYDGCLSVNSAEFFFDAATTAYITFIDELRDVAKDLGPLVGIIALRFMRKTPAKLGMQRWARTVSIEVAVPRPGKANAEYMSQMQALAFKFGGIPHWGQEHSIDAARVAEIYGAGLDTWRWALAETDPGKKKNTFSSRFTRERGLEAPEELDSYRSRRYVAAIVSGAY